MLIDSLPVDTIHWNHKVQSVDSLTNGKHLATFGNGSQVTSELLIGADGAWSKVRQLVTNEKPIYSGTVFVEAFISNARVSHPASAKLIGTGTLIASHPGKAIFAHHYANGSIRLYAAVKKSLEWINSFDSTNPKEFLGEVANEFADWSCDLTSLITGSESAPIVRPIFALPIDHEWKRTPGVTLLGDAAHLMSPFAGEGANLALLDGAELGEAITKHPGDIEGALDAYERSLFPRSREFAMKTSQNIERFFDHTAPNGVVEMFKRF
ncbi:MAG: FAD-dependent monooxygenase [Proteobacteria bacterium]|nr:MAG: FAD-dependent monooxygenase [Pseudomonadota bacterium]